MNEYGPGGLETMDRLSNPDHAKTSSKAFKDLGGSDESRENPLAAILQESREEANGRCLFREGVSQEESRFRLALASFLENHEEILRTAIDFMNHRTTTGTSATGFFNVLINDFRRVGRENGAITIVRMILNISQEVIDQHFDKLRQFSGDPRNRKRISDIEEDLKNLRSQWNSLRQNNP